MSTGEQAGVSPQATVSITRTTVDAPSEAEAAPGLDSTEGQAAPPVADGGSDREAAPAPDEVDRDLELSRRFAGLSKRETRARRLETELQESLETARTQQVALDEMREQLELALADPVEWALQNGRDPVEIAERIARPESKEEKRIRLLEERLEAQDRAVQERERLAEEAASEDESFQVMRAFVADITADNAPHLTSLYEPHEVPSLVRELLARPSHPGVRDSPSVLQAFRHQYDRDPSDAEIRESLEAEAAVRATRLLELQRRLTSSSQADSALELERDAPVRANGISNQHAAVSATSRAQPLSHEERRKRARAELTAALEAEAARE